MARGSYHSHQLVSLLMEKCLTGRYSTDQNCFTNTKKTTTLCFHSVQQLEELRFKLTEEMRELAKTNGTELHVCQLLIRKSLFSYDVSSQMQIWRSISCVQFVC